MKHSNNNSQQEMSIIRLSRTTNLRSIPAADLLSFYNNLTLIGRVRPRVVLALRLNKTMMIVF